MDTKFTLELKPLNFNTCYKKMGNHASILTTCIDVDKKKYYNISLKTCIMYDIIFKYTSKITKIELVASGTLLYTYNNTNLSDQISLTDLVLPRAALYSQCVEFILYSELPTSCVLCYTNLTYIPVTLFRYYIVIDNQYYSIFNGKITLLKDLSFIGERYTLIYDYKLSSEQQVDTEYTMCCVTHEDCSNIIENMPHKHTNHIKYNYGVSSKNVLVKSDNLSDITAYLEKVGAKYQFSPHFKDFTEETKNKMREYNLKSMNNTLSYYTALCD